MEIEAIMHNYRELIETEAKAINQLYQCVKNTLKNKSKDHFSWQKACDNFHCYESKIEFYILQVKKNDNFTSKTFKNKNLIEFILTYLEVDPWYFGSGYIKQNMLRKIKRMSFSSLQLKRLIIILKDAVENRPYREFKSYFSLAHVVAGKDLLEYLNDILNQPASSKRSRAKLMLSYCKI